MGILFTVTDIDCAVRIKETANERIIGDKMKKESKIFFVILTIFLMLTVLSASIAASRSFASSYFSFASAAGSICGA